MKKFSIALMVLALCLVSLAVSASGTTISANAIVNGDAVTVNVEATGNVVVLAVRDGGIFSADGLVALKDATSQIIFVDQFDASTKSSVTFVPKAGVDGGAVTIFVGAAGSDVTVLSLVNGCFVADTISVDAGYYLEDAATKYAISITADVDTAAAANATKYGCAIYITAGDEVEIESTGALEAGETAFSVIATDIPAEDVEAEVFFKPYIIVNGEVYWGAARAYSVSGLGAVDNNIGA